MGSWKFQMLAGLVYVDFTWAVDDVTGAEFVHEYQTITNNIGRRELVLRAIDNGIIKRGMTFTEVQRLFGEQNIRIIREVKSRPSRARVHFTPAPVQPKSSNPRAAVRAVGFTGWY